MRRDRRSEAAARSSRARGGEPGTLGAHSARPSCWHASRRSALPRADETWALGRNTRPGDCPAV
eukprot:9411009-Pyramimonas_sp.AAC.1